MSRRRILAIFRRVATEIRRDRPSIALLFIAPLVITGLVTFILREGQTPTVHAAVVAPAGPAGAMVSAKLVASIIEDGGSAVLSDDEDTARAVVRDGSATVAVILPGDLLTASSPSITLITEGLDPASEATQVGALRSAILSVASAAGRGIPTLTHVAIYGTPGSDPVQGFAPALVGFFVYFFVYILTGVSFLRERTGGTLERLMATPVSRAEVVTGYEMGFGAFAMLQVALIMLWVLGSVTIPSIGPLPPFSIGLGIATSGSPLVAFIVVVTLALGAVSLGILISTVARTELQIIEFIPIVIVPQFLLSGIIFPVSSLPAILAPLATIMPVHYAIDALKQVFIRDAGLADAALLVDLAVLAGFALVFAGMAALTIRREIA